LEKTLKNLSAFIFTLMLAVCVVLHARAQAAETIWIETNRDSYFSNETVTILLMANTLSTANSFTFRLSYDPACLQPAVPASLTADLNYKATPQTTGTVDAFFSSPSSFKPDGALAQVEFQILASCQTVIKLENATLNSTDVAGVSTPIKGISQGISSLVLKLTAAQALTPGISRSSETPSTTLIPQSRALITPETNLALTPSPSPNSLILWLSNLQGIVLSVIIFAALIVLVVALVRRRRASGTITTLVASENPVLIFKRGPLASATLPVINFPCRIGSSPSNDFCLKDPRVSPAHAEILADFYGYTLVDLDSQEGTYLNGQMMKNHQALLVPGDIMRIGSSVILFGQI